MSNKFRQDVLILEESLKDFQKNLIVYQAIASRISYRDPYSSNQLLTCVNGINDLIYTSSSVIDTLRQVGDD